MNKIAGILILFIVISMSFSCKKDDITTDPSVKLDFSTDTVMFDTVFTTIGSTTKRLVIRNKNSDKIVVSKINLGNGANSQFRINVDGIPGNTHSNIEINGNDSLFIFLEVTIDPNDILSPFIVNDQINFLVNGNTQHVELVAWGQNAHYFVANRSVSGIPLVYLDRDNSDGALDSVWTNDKPYVIYNGYLTLDGDDKLTIEKGVRVHLNNNAGIWVFQGANIRVNGTLDEPVSFKGTRLDFAFQGVAGQWDRIWINEGSTDNVFNYAIIKNAFIGIQAETLPFEPNLPTSTNKLRLNNCIIDNSSLVGILASNYRITDTNSVITNSGQFNILVRGGGEYLFNHSTIANYWTQSARETPALFLQNFYSDINGNTQVRDITAANFSNCIIDGNQEIEFDHDVLSPGSINFEFNHCIIKTTNNLSSSNFINVISSPFSDLFTDISNNDFSLADESPAIDQGFASGVLLDHLGNIRNNPPDIGAFEN